MGDVRRGHGASAPGARPGVPSHHPRRAQGRRRRRAQASHRRQQGVELYQGANDRGKKYNALSQILKGKKGGRTTREQIDFFIEIADKSGASNPGLPSVDQAKLASAKRWVLTAWEYPGNAQAQAASKEATEWLQQHGYAVEYDPADGRPIFRWLN